MDAKLLETVTFVERFCGGVRDLNVQVNTVDLGRGRLGRGADDMFQALGAEAARPVRLEKDASSERLEDKHTNLCAPPKLP